MTKTKHMRLIALAVATSISAATITFAGQSNSDQSKQPPAPEERVADAKLSSDAHSFSNRRQHRRHRRHHHHGSSMKHMERVPRAKSLKQESW